mgnify:CR=1 FL=1
MNLERFLEHHGLSMNPFDAEEARHDRVFQKLAVQAQQNHPDFAKIAGRVDQPSTAVVFGEKGSGKTAIRLMMGQRIAFHNESYPNERVLLVAYDDLNPVLDNFLQFRSRNRSRFSRSKNDKPLEEFRLQDHQDAILSLAVTKLVDALTQTSEDQSDPLPLPKLTRKFVSAIPRQSRMDMLVLAALYDQPRSGSAIRRWGKLQRVLRMGKWVAPTWTKYAAITLTVLTLIATAVGYLHHLNWVTTHRLILPGSAVLAVLAIGFWGYWGLRGWKLRSLDKAITRDTPTIRREPRRIARLFSRYCLPELAGQPWPDGQLRSDARYALTQRLIGFLSHMGYKGLTILVDRMDEPSVISGNPERMRAITWPLLDNKFLQQEHVGVKLLLPIELRHILHRQDSDFFQTARLDKQHTIDRLVWSGATLYDLCSARLTACQRDPSRPLYLTDMFDPEVTREVLIEALDDMQQPREAFKFLYGVLQEHCRMSTQEQPRFLIPRLTLDAVRRQHAQRIADLRRGLAPV